MISDKQRAILAFPYTGHTAIICDGAVRAGKTAFLMVSYVRWAMERYDRQAFIVGGRTVASAIRNVVEPFMALSWARKRYAMTFRRQENKLIVSDGRHENYFLIFGGKDESSYMLVQGFTAAGCLIDEVVLCVQSFVNQCLARCSVEGSKFFFSCNPGNPNHWFYRDWIQHADRHDAVYVRFTIHDNPGLSPAMVERYESQYSGLFYDRYILGEWVQPEGLVYQDWANGEIVGECKATGRDVCFVGVDYGILNPFAAGLWVVRDGVACLCDEWYHDGRADGQMTDEELYGGMREMIGGRYVDEIVVDPSASSFIEVIRRHGEYDVLKANNDVLKGIRTVSQAMGAGCVRISPKCKDAIRELGLYRWDDKAAKDSVAKTDDHAMDAMRYVIVTALRDQLRCFQ